ncbi:hypothetical protein Tco_1017747 [Tanacetum coccineum]|uniref:Uncharacterized protein n=1 Tax=Tanacetum coccineum TaxID=301880 RepID=A0ABQ5FUB3_9ASTR
MSSLPEFSDDHYILHDHVMYPVALHYERKTRADHDMKRCCHSASSFSSTPVNPKSSHPINDENVTSDEGVSRG